MEKDLISIIIPVYNVEKYLKECVDSVRKQTYKNLEIILIDDGSKDNSGKLCDELAKEDNRIKVIHKENGGLSDARNVGIENATGEYIQFIDSDDFVEKDMIEILHNDICQEKADVSMCSLYLYKDGEKTTDASYKREIFNKEQVLKEILLDERVRSYAWNKMFKKSLFESIRFPKGKVFEDIYTMSPIFQKANKIVFNDIPLYYYRQREGSILHNQTNELRLEYIKAAMFVNKDIEKNFPNLKDFCAYNIPRKGTEVFYVCFKENNCVLYSVCDDYRYKQCRVCGGHGGQLVLHG
jgi:glycosyltransferase involved in cell wall biosynthesis